MREASRSCAISERRCAAAEYHQFPGERLNGRVGASAKISVKVNVNIANQWLLDEQEHHLSYVKKKKHGGNTYFGRGPRHILKGWLLNNTDCDTYAVGVKR